MARFFGLPKAVEDMIQVFFFYAYTVVFYLDFDSWVLFGQGYDDFFVFRCVFNGIVKQNAEQLLYHHFVCDNFDVVVDASYGEVMSVVIENMASMTIVFYGIALYEGYKLSFSAQKAPEGGKIWI